VLLKNLDKQKIAYVKIEMILMMLYFYVTKKYAEVTVIADSNLDSLQVKLKPFTTVIIGYHKSDVALKG
jgi:hypothetical protein